MGSGAEVDLGHGTVDETTDDQVENMVELVEMEVTRAKLM